MKFLIQEKKLWAKGKAHRQGEDKRRNEECDLRMLMYILLCKEFYSLVSFKKQKINVSIKIFLI